MEEGGRTPRPRISPAAMAAVQSWADIHDNILACVSSFLPCHADRVHMVSVNRHWYAAVRGLGRPPPPLLPPLQEPPPQLLWLIFPSTESPTFYSILGDRYHRLYGLPADVRAARLRGSGSSGWLILAFAAPHAHALYNLNSGERIPLPPGFRSPSDNAEVPLVVLAATFSSSPSNASCVVAAIALVDNRPTAAFWSPGSESWFSTGDPLTVMPQDVMYYSGAFYFVTPREELIVFRTAYGPNGDMICGRADLDMRQRMDYDIDVQLMHEMGTKKRYLVASRSDLLMVVRDVYYQNGTQMLRVFQLSATAVTNGRRPRCTWDEIFWLNGRMLSVGPGCSRSFELANYDGFQDQDSMIYFLDESFDSVPQSARLYSFTDMGRYSTVQLIREPWPPAPWPATSHDAPPTWWFH